MDTRLRIVLIAAVLIYFSVVISLLKKKKLALRYTLLWLTAGITMLLIALFPSVFEILVHFLGVKELTNGLFAILSFFMLVIMVSITSIVSKLNEQIRSLAQRCAIYEYRIRQLENKLQEEER